MKRIKALQLTQFFLYESAQYDLKDMTGITAPTGTGKSSTVDAAILILAGVNKRFMPFNAQTDDRGARSVKEYCLGVVYDKDGAGTSFASQARHESLSYVAILIHDEDTDVWTTAGVCIAARDEDREEEVKGRFVARGVKLELGDYLVGTENQKRPRQWEDFAEDVRRRGKAAGYEAEFATGAENFTQSLLYQMIGPGVDHRRFLRTMNTSLKLNKIPSVDGFVRNFLVESKPIDKEQALTQIRELRSLLELIAVVEKKIARLGTIEKRGERLLAVENEGKASSLYLVELNKDESMDKQVSAENNIEKLEREIALKTARHKKDDEKYQQGLEEVTRFETALSNDENRRKHDNYAELIESKKALLASQSEVLLTTIRTTQQSLIELSRTSSLKHKKAMLSEAGESLMSEAISSVKSGELELLITAFDHAATVLKSVDEDIDNALRDLETRVNNLREDKASLEGRIAAGGVHVSKHVSVAMGLLHAEGIEARPAFEGVAVKDASWQGAIEAFLNRNLEALIVPEGQENKAVSVLMNHPDRDATRKTKVVQPHHFRQNNKPADDTVASLVTNSCPEGQIAARYLQAVLGNMVQVKDVEGLRIHSRSMMPNGAFSANFGTHPYPQALPERLWKLGERAQRADPDELRRELKSKIEELSRASSELEAVRSASRLVPTVKGGETVKQTLIENANPIAVTLEGIAHLETLISAVDISATEELQSQLADAKQRNNRLLGNLQTTASEIAKAEQMIQTQSSVVREESEKFDQLAQQYKQLRAELELDDQFVELLRVKIDPEDTKPVSEKREKAMQLGKKAEQRVRDEGHLIQKEFTRFCEDFDESLMEERYDWRLAHKYSEKVGLELRETTLVAQKSKVDDARLAAEEAFRSHVAVTIYAEIQQLKKGINDLNAIMRNCNEFTNGERYKFICNHRPEFKPIYNYIEQAAKSDGPLFMEHGQEDVIELLEQLSDSDGELDENPLEDYLLMFEFDVEIQVDGQRRGLLSKRLGKGSGGEHKAPLYVIVAAALHHAYRLGSNPGAAGVMLIDEAFEKLDVNNALAVSDFIRGLGLQVIAAAPDDRHNLMAMCMERVYTLMRYDQVRLDVEYADYKNGTRELLSSDDPKLNPDLLDEMAPKYAVSS